MIWEGISNTKKSYQTVKSGNRDHHGTVAHMSDYKLVDC